MFSPCTGRDCGPNRRNGDWWYFYSCPRFRLHKVCSTTGTGKSYLFPSHSSKLWAKPGVNRDDFCWFALHCCLPPYSTVASLQIWKYKPALPSALATPLHTWTAQLAGVGRWRLKRDSVLESVVDRRHEVSTRQLPAMSSVSTALNRNCHTVLSLATMDKMPSVSQVRTVVCSVPGLFLQSCRHHRQLASPHQQHKRQPRHQTPRGDPAGSPSPPPPPPQHRPQEVCSHPSRVAILAVALWETTMCGCLRVCDNHSLSMEILICFYKAVVQYYLLHFIEHLLY